MKISINYDIPVGELAESLHSYVDTKDEDVFALIKALDERVADWDFTEKLTEYFVGLCNNCAADIPLSVRFVDKEKENSE